MTEIKPLTTLSGRGIGASSLGREPNDDLEHVFARNAVPMIGEALYAEEWTNTDDQSEAVMERMRASLRAGELRAAVFKTSFWPVKPERWFGDDADIRRRFSSWKMTPYAESFSSPEWWFIERESLKHFIFRHGAPPQTSSPFAFDMDDWRWRLYDACIWIATGGHNTTTGEIARDDLADAGARILFKKLDQLGMEGPAVTGRTTGEHRIAVPHSYWERAHTGWLGFGAGHRIDFYESSDDPGQVTADLTPHKSALPKPMFMDLRIERDALLNLFPKKPKAGNKRKSDDPQVAEAEQLVLSGKARSASDAARSVANRLQGEHSTEAAYWRIYRKMDRGLINKQHK